MKTKKTNNMTLQKAIEILEAYSQTRMNTELPIVEAIDTILEAVKPKAKAQKKCCGNCNHFENEEINGCGYCAVQEKVAHCEWKCSQYKPINPTKP
jgi:hypothetical protein